MSLLQDRISELIEQHGSLRAAARVLDCDAGYLSRLQSGEKDNPEGWLLRRMKLHRVVSYERIDCAGGMRCTTCPGKKHCNTGCMRQGDASEALAALDDLRDALYEGMPLERETIKQFIQARATTTKEKGSGAQASSTPMTDENAGQRITDMLMECAERLGNFSRAEVDPRAWEHLLVYAPSPQPQSDAEGEQRG